jgi:hypothetical protein
LTAFEKKGVGEYSALTNLDRKELFLVSKEVGEYSDLTSWNRAFLVNLTVPQLVKKFPIFNGPERFTTIFTPAC